MPADVQVTVLHKTMDDNTAQFARVSGKVSMDSYTDLKSYVEEQYQIELGRKIDTKDRNLNTLVEGEGDRWKEEECSHDRHDLDALKGGKKGKGGGKDGWG